MNTLMYEHPLTADHLKIVRELIGYQVIGPMSKALACGDVGEWTFESVSEPTHV
jgi:phosphopantothenoylcysteine decarboxylase